MKKGKGYLKIFTGSMFAGKTEALIEQYHSIKNSDITVKYITHYLETKYSISGNICIVTSHSGKQVYAKVERLAKDITVSTDAVIIDEAQFFDIHLIPIVKDLLLDGIIVILGGLCLDYTGTPLEPIKTLMSFADEVNILHGKCAKCDSSSLYSHLLIKSEDKFIPGGADKYIPLCRDCFNNSN